MSLSKPNSQPHIFGAKALHYRQGTAVANGETPPHWSPEMALDQEFPYSLREWTKDVSRWCAATKVSPERQGPLLALAVGGAGRVAVDEISEALLKNGAVVDLGDGQGSIHHSGCSLLLCVLQRKFPENLEVQMLRAGLEFFAFI